MTTYCNPSDTARVTFPDGSVRDFSNTSITINCDPKPDNCSRYNVSIRVNNVNGSNQAFTAIINAAKKAPLRGLYLQKFTNLPNENFYQRLRILDNGSASFSNCASTDDIIYAVSWPNKIISYEILSIDYLSPKKEIKIFNTEGMLLFSGIFDNCNYSVECVDNCPEGTLNCGDCCLDCEDIFYKLCNINQLFIG
ncbi:MAG: hypothetical protein RLZZ507_4687 [Cyanobacteriota bacterium]